MSVFTTIIIIIIIIIIIKWLSYSTQWITDPSVRFTTKNNKY